MRKILKNQKRKNNIKCYIKYVSWILFQILTVGIFMKYTRLDKWLWNVDFIY